MSSAHRRPVSSERGWRHGLLAATFLLAAVLLTASQATATATVTHVYELNGSFADSLGGPAMTSASGSPGPTGFSFSGGAEPSLSNAIDPSDYSIELFFSADTTSGWRKLIDFKNLTSDNGLYINDGRARFYGLTGDSSVVFAAGVDTHLFITRDGTTNAVRVYVDSSTAILSATDTSGHATFTGPNDIIRFFDDDTVSSGQEQTAGFLDFVRIYDGVLTTQQIDDRLVFVPEPSTVVLLGGGLLALGARRWRR